MDKPKTFGGRQDGAGRKKLAPDKKKRRIVTYVTPDIADWIELNGGSKLVAQLLADAFRKGLIV